MIDLDHCLAILKALQVSEIVYHLSGGGDSGTAEIETVSYLDGHCRALPTVTIGITDQGKVIRLDERLDCLVEDIPEFDWINNEGGYGNVILRPQEIDEDLRVECDMTYGDEDEQQDFEDDEEFVAPDVEDARLGDTDAPPAVDDSALHLPQGETP
jgi:hypothetical protein